MQAATNRIFLLGGIWAGLLAFSACGATSRQDSAAARYQPILEKTYRLLSAGADAPIEQMDMDGMTGIFDASTALAGETPLAQIGYCIEDISGDGVPELLLGMLADAQTDASGQYLFAVYTLVEGVPHCTVEGWYRNNYYLLESGDLLWESSAGARYSMLGRYALSADGTALDCMDFYFTEPNEENLDGSKYYYNTTADAVAALSEEVTGEAYYQAQRAWEGQMQEIAYTPFAAFTPPAAAQESAG